MPRERPAMITTVAILNLIIGGLGLLCGVCGLGGIAFSGGLLKMTGAAAGDVMAGINERVPGFYFWLFAKISLALVLSVLLVVAGIGLLNRKKWGRTLSLVYAVLTIPLQIAYVLFQLLLVQPANKEVLARVRPAPMAPGQAAGQEIGQQIGQVIAVIGPASLFVLYSVTVLVVMFLPSATQAFTPGPLRQRQIEEENYDDRDDKRA